MLVEWSQTARANLARIFEFNFGWSEDWAFRVDRRLVERGEALGRTPLIGSPMGSSGLRKLSVVDIRYVLTYRLDMERVTIVRVHNTRENREDL